MVNKKSLLLFVSALAAVFFFNPFPVYAEISTEFLYKFQSRFSDVAVNLAGTRIFVINESYSRIEEYDASGVLQKVHGSFGTTSTTYNRPQGLTIDSSDILYVLDSGNNRVIRYTTALGVSGSALGVTTTWGSSGSTVGTFNNPTGITSDGTNVYITDTDNNRVQKCVGLTGSCAVWGSLGIGDGQLSSPKGIVYDASSTDVFVADTGNNRIQRFTNTGTFQSKIDTAGQFVLPLRIAAETTGSYVYVLDALSRVQRVNKTTGVTDSTITLTTPGGGIYILGSATLYISTLPTSIQTYNPLTMAAIVSPVSTEAGRPVDMSIDTDGKIYLLNNFATAFSAPVVQRFNSSFVQDAEWTGNGGFGLSVNGPMGLGINTGHDFIVADTDNNAIQKFKYDGNTGVASWEESITPQPTPGAFNSPKDVVSEATGNYYVADTGNGRIVKFEPDGTFIWSQLLPTVEATTPTPFGGTPPAPYGITLDTNNDIFVADIGYHRILKYSPNLSPTPGYISSWGEYGSADVSVIPQLTRPQGMAIDSAGNIYVADTGHNRVQKFNSTGGAQVKWGQYGTQDGNFDQPRNVGIDASNRIFVSEVGNKRVQVFGSIAADKGLTITTTNGTSISEGTTDALSGIDSYTVKLKTQPSSTVVINITLTAADALSARVINSALYFNQFNWNIPQTVTVVPIHNSIQDPASRTVTLTHSPDATLTIDTNYKTIASYDIPVTITDTIDTAQVNFTFNIASNDYIPGENTIPWATEGATFANAYSVTLNTKPTADVTITLIPDASLSLDYTSLTFTTSNYNTPRYIGITATHDFVAQATHSGTIAHVATSTDTNYDGGNAFFTNSSGNVAVTIQDIDTAGIVLSESTVAVTENSTTDTYTVKLNSKPTSSVEVYPTDNSSPTSLVTLSPTTLTFSTTDWNTPQTVTVTAIHDYLKNPVDPRTADIIHPSTFSADPNYLNIPVVHIAGTVTDSDTGGLLIFKPGGGSVTIAEGGATDDYAFQLTSIPTADVNVTITSTDNQATTSAYFYTFTPSNWNEAQYATASAVDDALEEGAHTGVLIHTLTSSDPNFDGKISNQTPVITDNDAAGITITLPNSVINIAEAGPADNYFVKLNSQPSQQVTLIFSAENQATASPTSLATIPNLVFNPSTWNVNQEVVLTAIQDYIVEGAHTATVLYTAVSADTKYSGKTASFTANIADDDSLYPGVSIIETDGGTAVTKDVTTDTYTIALMSKPSANVKVKLVANGPEATTSAGVYYFLPAEWNVPKTVNVSAVTSPSGGKTVIFSHLITSLDAHYQDITAPTVNVTVNENVASSPSAANAKPPTCGKTPPYSAPNLFQVTTTQTHATLYFTPIHDNISYYFIAYGFEPGDFRFGTSFQMGSYDGVISYDVNMLTPGTTYYFTVRGGNGCATGPWSAALKATAVGSESSSTAMRTYYATATSVAGSGGTSGGTSGGSSSPTGGIWLTRDLYPGSQGADVRSLQEYLNARGFTLSTSGAGSPGHETTYYGNLTASAVRRFQEAHFAEILSPLGYASGTGICGSSTRNYINSHP